MPGWTFENNDKMVFIEVYNNELTIDYFHTSKNSIITINQDCLTNEIATLVCHYIFANLKNHQFIETDKYDLYDIDDNLHVIKLE